MSTDAPAEPAARPPGRPRSAQADAAINQATLDILVEGGYRAMSVEAVRVRAGVGKATIYRRHPNKQALVRAALEHLQNDLRAPDTGALVDDMLGLIASAYQTAYSKRAGWMMPALMAESADDDELYELFRRHLVEPRREVVRGVLRRATARGEVRPDLDPELGVDLLVGPLLYRVMIAGGRLDRLSGDPAEVFRAILDGIRAR